MKLCDLIQEKNLSIYRLSKNSGIPYATLNDIVNDKARLEKCKAETVYRLAKKELDLSMEDLLAPYISKRCDFELFKSNVCHSLKDLGDIDFIVETLEKDEIREYYNRQWYREAFYLLAMLDYISRINNVPACEEYEDIRCKKTTVNHLPQKSILALSAVSKRRECKGTRQKKESIPEFMRFNIVENEVRNVL